MQEKMVKWLGGSFEIKKQKEPIVIDGETFKDPIFIEGYASSFNKDYDGETVEGKDSFPKEVMDKFMEKPVILANHTNGIAEAVGKVLEYRLDDFGLWIKAILSESVDSFTQMVRKKVKEGILKCFSIGGIFEMVGKIIKKVNLFEITITPIGANPDAIFEVKSVIPYKQTAKAEIDEAWDASAEVKKAEVKDLKIICAYYDKENPDIKGSYKFPHHHIEGYKVNYKACSSGIAALNGARGQMPDIPDSDRQGVYNHLRKHIVDDFEKEAPELKIFETLGNKAGRILSKSNEEKLWGALKEIEEVLKQLEKYTEST